MKSPSGCEVIAVSAIWGFFERYKFIIGPTLIILGLYMCFLGNTHRNVSLGFLGHIMTFCVLSVGFFSLVDVEEEVTIVYSWYIMIVTFIIGPILSFAMT